MGLLENKVAIVTGAGNGIGKATALLFAREGASVIVNDADLSADGSPMDPGAAARVVAQIVSAGGKAIASSDSVCASGGAKAIVELALATFGRLDVLVNNAGFLRDQSLLKMPERDFSDVVDVHLKGCFASCQAAIPAMKKQGSGAIVNTTGMPGLLGNYGQANLSAAQAGVYGLTRTASIELQRFRIRVNAVAPLAKTRLTEDLPMFEHVDSMRPEHVAPVHLFLASELAENTTGVVIGVAGGRLSAYRVVESGGQFKELDEGVWSAQEIADHFVAIRKI
jgi:NAD(P)-dependent dehydrogenase (short-subunit alcohol dehydrogenase family)